MARKKASSPHPGGGGIDWEAVRLAWGLGVLVAGVGALILWGVLTAPPGAARGVASRATSVSYGLARMLPASVVGRLAAAFGGLMIGGGVWMFLLGCMQFLPSKRKLSR
jgi:hypothetical protein